MEETESQEEDDNVLNEINLPQKVADEIEMHQKYKASNERNAEIFSSG